MYNIDLNLILAIINGDYTKNLLKHHINISLMNVKQFKSNQHTKYFA